MNVSIGAWINKGMMWLLPEEKLLASQQYFKKNLKQGYRGSQDFFRKFRLGHWKGRQVFAIYISSWWSRALGKASSLQNYILTEGKVYCWLQRDVQTFFIGAEWWAGRAWNQEKRVTLKRCHFYSLMYPKCLEQYPTCSRFSVCTC